MAEAQSILDSVKKVLNITPDDTDFDIDIIMHINSVFSTLYQLGVGPKTDFGIEDKNKTWDQFLGNSPHMNSVKTYMVQRVRLIFDPPTTSYALDSFKEQIKEAEVRLLMQSHDNAAPYMPPVTPPTPVNPGFPAPTIWDLTGLTDFPSNAPYNAVGIDVATLLVYRNI
jgi:hypothetical protein